MAAQGLRDMGDGHEKIANPIEALSLKLRGREILIASIATAAVATTLALLAKSL